MSERFIRLFTAESNLHVDGSPVIVEAGALLKDTVNNNIIAQLKFLNFSEKTISYLRVYIYPLDSMNQRIGEAIAFEYLDISIPTDAEFGSKQPLFMPNASTRAFEIYGYDVRFEDGTSWSCKNSKWNSLKSDAEEFKYSKEEIEIYQEASALCKSNDKTALIKAIELFNKIKDHRPVEEEIKYCEERIRILKEKEIVEIYKEASALCKSDNKYALIRAIKLFDELKDHRSVEEEIKRCKERIKILNEQKQEDIKKYEKKRRILAFVFVAFIIITIILLLLLLFLIN